MTREDAKNVIKNLNLTDRDKRTFQNFQPLAQHFKPHVGNILLTEEAGSRTIGEDEYTTLTLAPENGQGAKVPVTLAFDVRNFFVNGKSIRTLGTEGDIDAAVANLAAFEVQDVKPTGFHPMLSSKAAVETGYYGKEASKMEQADWRKLGEAYNASDDMKAAADETVGADREIHEIHIVPVN